MTTVDGASTPVEAVLARHTARRGLYVVPLLVAVFAAVRGAPGAVGAAVGGAVVIANVLLVGAMLSVAIRVSLAMYHAAALLGFLLRLGLTIGAILVIASAFDIDRVSFGIAAVVTYIVLFALEVVAVARGRERELDWTT